MFGKLGIGGRLFLAFAGIMGLSLVSGLVGWLELREVAGTQATITRNAMPAAAQAQGIAEASIRLIARSPRLTEAVSEPQRQTQAAQLFADAEALRQNLRDLGRYGFDSATIDALQSSVERIIENLSAQDGLVRRRLALNTRADDLLTEAQDAAAGLYDLSETLLSNAAAGTSAVIANLYDLVEDPAGTETTFQALDRLVESDVYTMERMFELRLRSSQIGLLFNQLSKATSTAEIDGLQSDLDRDLLILNRRVDGIADPVRRVQAQALFERLRAINGQEESVNLFRVRRAILATGEEIARFAEENRLLSNELSELAEGLVAETAAITESATQEAESSVKVGLITLLVLTLASLAAAALIIWLYVRGNVITRLKYLADRMTDLARGDLGVVVQASGHDELTEMARTIQFFKQEAVRKREIEIARDSAETELRRHKEELEQVVQERTRQLSDANARLQHEVESHAEARERAEQASRAKSEFLATMSHEIRTPMNGMLGMLQVLGNSKLHREQQDQLRIVETSGEALLAILNDILDYSKIESGHLQIDSVDFEPKPLVAGILSLMQARAKEKGIELEVNYGSAVPEILKGDPGKLRQVLFNLIGNAIKFTDEGRVRLSITQSANGSLQNTELRFEVADSGIGLPADRTDKVFDAFFQLDSSVSRRYGGTGLGLAISKNLVTALGGEMGVESELGVGSRFWFTLAFAPGDSAVLSAHTERAPAQAADNLSPRRILVVEDNEINRLVARSFLEEMGHRVSLANDGIEALRAIEAEAFDAVLMDISLPGMDGLEATRRIRALSDTRKRSLPIIAMSAHVFTSEIDEHLKAGMDAFIGKPMSQVRLQQVLSQVFSHGAPPCGAGTQPSNGIASARQSLAEDLRVMGPERTERMVRLFLETTPERVRQLAAAIAAEDFDAASFAAHSLRNSAGSVGLEQLADRLNALEAAAEEGEKVTLTELFDGFGALFEESASYLTETWNELRG